MMSWLQCRRAWPRWRIPPACWCMAKPWHWLVGIPSYISVTALFCLPCLQGCDVSRHVLVSRPSRDLILRSWSRSWKKRSWSWSRSWEKRSWSWSRSWDQRSWCLGLETKTKTSNSGCVLMSWKNAKHRLHVLRDSCFMSKGENARRKIQSWLHAQYLSLSWTQLSEITVCTSFIDTAASSAPVERVFQHSGLIMKPHRGRIDESFLEALVYLKCNWYSSSFSNP